MEHPPFPQAGPAIPPPARSRGVVDDDVGTLGTHPENTDDDSNERLEDEEGEYDRSDE